MRRLVTPLLVGMISLVVGIGALAPAADAKAKPAWSLKFSGGIAGTATDIKVVSCTKAAPTGNQLNPTATFKVAKASYQIQILLIPPLSAGSRPFGHTASSTTATVDVSSAAKTSATWTSGDGNGTAVVNADLKSGSINGQLIGLGANGIATKVTGKFSCPTFTL
jgi:hypothetical protein